MSCASPWRYSAEATYEVFEYEIGCEGSTTVPGYTLPSEKLCLPDWKAPYSDCKWGGKWGTKLECKWVKGETKWYDCWGTPTVELLPNLTVGYQLGLPISFELAVGESISPIATGEAYTVAAFSIGNFTLKLNVNGTNVDLTIPCAITISEENGDFSTQYNLGSLKGDYDVDGIKYELDFTFSLLGCLEPLAPEGWLNIKVSCELTIDYEGIDDYSITFSVVCPIVTAELET